MLQEQNTGLQNRIISMKMLHVYSMHKSFLIKMFCNDKDNRIKSVYSKVNLNSV